MPDFQSGKPSLEARHPDYPIKFSTFIIPVLREQSPFGAGF
jgi:hypothetical protein